MIYSPLGGMAKEQFGTDTALYNKSFYNSRGQLSEIRVGTYHATDESWWNRGAIINHYSNNCWGMCGGESSTQSMTDNNGNSIQKVSGGGSWYDAGAVSSQTITAGDGYMEFTPGETWSNRMCGLGNTSSSAFYGDIEYAFQLAGGGGLNIYESGTFRGNFGSYAAGDRLKVAVEAGVVKYYRNSTVVYTSTVAPPYPLQVDTSLFSVYAGISNVVIASSSSAGGSGAIQWLVADQLGTPHMIVDKTGNLANVKRHDYLPFGEELVASQGLRSTVLGYAADMVRQKFTQYERDNETDLDYAQARYYASKQGRFTSVDPLMASAIAGNPQTFNRYTYALNSPQTHTDPTGMLPVDQAPGSWGPGGDEGEGGGGALSGGNYSRYLYTVTVEAAIGDPIVEPPQNTGQDNTVQVTEAMIEPNHIRGKVSLNEVTFSINSKATAATIFGENGSEGFDVVLYLALPKNTTTLESTEIKKKAVNYRTNAKGERVVNYTEVVEGSHVKTRGSENNFHVGKGIVKLTDVDIGGGIATATLRVEGRGFDARHSNSLDVVIKGQTKRHFISTTIRVTILPPPRR